MKRKSDRYASDNVGCSIASIELHRYLLGADEPLRESELPIGRQTPAEHMSWTEAAHDR